MTKVKWIKIVTDIFDDEKILLIENMPDADTIIIIWFKLLCLAGKINNGGVLLMNGNMPYTEEMLSIIFKRPLDKIKTAIKIFEQFGMIEIKNNTITISNWNKHQSLGKLQDRKEYMRSYMQQYRNNDIVPDDNDDADDDADDDVNIVNNNVNSNVNNNVNNSENLCKQNVNSQEEEIEEEEEKEREGEIDKKENKKKKNVYMDFPFAELVKITPEEYQKLMDKYGEEEAKQRIINLDLYIGSKGDKYKSHYLTILNWDRMAQQRSRAGPNNANNVFFEILKEEGKL